jgi:chromosome partitioning protein
MPPVLSCVNLKGGVGKTALSVNFAIFCGSKGKRTLLIDLDPQTNATFSCISVEKWREHSRKSGSVANIFGLRGHTSGDGAPPDPKTVIVADVFENVDLLPSHLDLFTIDLDIGSFVARETILQRALLPVVPGYDIVICDCPPNLTIPTQNALAMSSHYVVPVSPDYLSSIGIALLLTRVRRFCTDLQHDLEHAGIVISRYGRQSAYRTRTEESLREEFGAAVFTSKLHERSVVSEAAEQQKSMYQMGGAQAILEFTAVSEELLNRIK